MCVTFVFNKMLQHTIAECASTGLWTTVDNGKKVTKIQNCAIFKYIIFMIHSHSTYFVVSLWPNEERERSFHRKICTWKSSIVVPISRKFHRKIKLNVNQFKERKFPKILFIPRTVWLNKVDNSMWIHTSREMSIIQTERKDKRTITNKKDIMLFPNCYFPGKRHSKPSKLGWQKIYMSLAHIW